MEETSPDTKAVMLGRGIVANPALAELALGKPQEEAMNRERLKHFYQKVFSDYQIELSGDKNLLFKMKEFWFYFGSIFLDAEKPLKKIRKAQKRVDYEMAVDQLFTDYEIVSCPGFVPKR